MIGKRPLTRGMPKSCMGTAARSEIIRVRTSSLGSSSPIWRFPMSRRPIMRIKYRMTVRKNAVVKGITSFLGGVFVGKGKNILCGPAGRKAGRICPTVRGLRAPGPCGYFCTRKSTQKPPARRAGPLPPSRLTPLRGIFILLRNETESLSFLRQPSGPMLGESLARLALNSGIWVLLPSLASTP